MNNNFITGILLFLIISLLVIVINFGISAYVRLEPANQVETTVKSGTIETKEDITTPQIVETPTEAIEEINMSDVNYQSSAARTRYFYSQLDSHSKIIYDGIATNIEKMKTGTYTVQYGSKFSNILSKENGQTELGNYYQSAIEAFTYDNPNIFYLDPTKMYLNIQTTTRGTTQTHNVYITCGNEANYLAKGFENEEQINQAQEQIEQIKNNIIANIQNSNIDKKIRYIHDYLVDNTSYDQTISQDNIYNLYGALINKECVCEGYAKAFKYLLDEAGIDSVIVAGIATNTNGETENHAWNYVAIEGNWYAIDVTWDDPIIQNIVLSAPSAYKNKYYLKGEIAISKDHTPNGQLSTGGKIFSYPSLTPTDY